MVKKFINVVRKGSNFKGRRQQATWRRKFFKNKEEERKFEKKKKALKTETWSNTECENSDEDKYANICLMVDSELEKEIEISHPEILMKHMNTLLNYI